MRITVSVFSFVTSISKRLLSVDKGENSDQYAFEKRVVYERGEEI